MEITEFWSIVDALDWRSICEDYKDGTVDNPNEEMKYSCENVFYENGGVKKADEFLKMFREMESNLNNRVKDKDVHLGISDDSWWDLRAHIVGLGKESYDFAMKYPGTIPVLYNTDPNRKQDIEGMQFVENFEYGVSKFIQDGGDDVRTDVVKKEVKTYMKFLYCPNCGEEMKFESESGPFLPGKFIHKCPNCGKTSIEDRRFPAIEYETI